MRITGSAPDRLTFAWNHDEDIDSPMSGPRWDWVVVDAVGHDEWVADP